MKIEWYFDYVSPFSYLQWAHQMPRLKEREVELKPVLFAGLLKRWGHKGPAEIAGKRRFTYRHVIWLARHFGVPCRIPSAHPFNPLPLLRASIALSNRPAAVDRLFGYVWRDGHVPADESSWLRLMKELQLENDALADPAVKQQLVANGEDAIAKDVFGVPSFVADGEVFWGVDGFDFFLEYLDDPQIVDTPEMRAADATPSGI